MSLIILKEYQMGIKENKLFFNSNVSEIVKKVIDLYAEENEIVKYVLITKYLNYGLKKAIDYIDGILKNNTKFIELFLEYDKIGHNNFINKYGNGK